MSNQFRTVRLTDTGIPVGVVASHEGRLVLYVQRWRLKTYLQATDLATLTVDDLPESVRTCCQLGDVETAPERTATPGNIFLWMASRSTASRR